LYRYNTATKELAAQVASERKAQDAAVKAEATAKANADKAAAAQP
jgi:hypothetical protein